MRFLGLVLISLALQVASPWAQGLPRSTPEQQGMSGERLERIAPVMADYVERGVFPGMTVAVARYGRLVYSESFGVSDLDRGNPVQEDSIFRIFSMSKPVTAAALMILYEEGKFTLDEPVSKYIPALKDVQIYRPEGSEESTKPSREMTIRDLARHTSGLGYGWSDDPVSKKYQVARLLNPEFTLEEMVNKLATLPLYFDPGTDWRYGVGIDVLGRIIEVISGQTLAEFFEQRLFKPLGMKDTGFSVPDDQAGRFTSCYRINEDGKLIALPLGYPSYSPGKNRLYSGGGGLVSTTADYLRFAQMLLNGGELDGVRILGPRTVELMSMDHLPKGVTAPWDKLYGHGYGLAVSVLTDVTESLGMGSVGDYGWDGAASTYFRIDPQEDLVILLMTHRMPCDTEIQVKLKTLVYQALIN
ncbi:MAG: beta-lactamase family protein [Acidobacteriota bacterium]|nr:MAG: beta-lactamase family protein [Acidobacteriota bacterium]